MYLTMKALVLRVTAYNDTDALLTILSQKSGKLTVKARGLRRRNSPLTAPCQLLAFSEFTLFEYKGMYTVNEAHSLDLFLPLRRDLAKLALAEYFAQASDVIALGDAPNPALLSLILNCLYVLSVKQLPMQQVKAVFELRCACIAGYQPDLQGCHHCGKTNPDRFDISAGRLECRQCRSGDSSGIRMPLTGGMLDAMRFICACDGKQLFSFTAEPETLENLAQVTESYFLTQLERGFSTLDFYKSLI